MLSPAGVGGVAHRPRSGWTMPTLLLDLVVDEVRALERPCALPTPAKAEWLPRRSWQEAPHALFWQVLC